MATFERPTHVGIIEQCVLSLAYHEFHNNILANFLFQSLDVPLASEVPSPPLDCDIVLPPPAESLYSLPGRTNKNSSTEHLISEDEETNLIAAAPSSSNRGTLRAVRFEMGKEPSNKAKAKKASGGLAAAAAGAHTESVV